MCKRAVKIKMCRVLNNVISTPRMLLMYKRNSSCLLFCGFLPVPDNVKHLGLKIQNSYLQLQSAKVKLNNWHSQHPISRQKDITPYSGAVFEQNVWFVCSLLPEGRFESSYPAIVYSQNNGETWKTWKLEDSSFQGAHKIHFFDEKRGLLAGEQLITKTSDGGHTRSSILTTKNVPGNSYLRIVDFTAQSLDSISITLSQYSALEPRTVETENGGLSWILSYTINPVMQTWDGGKTWQKPGGSGVTPTQVSSSDPQKPTSLPKENEAQKNKNVEKEVIDTVFDFLKKKTKGGGG